MQKSLYLTFHEQLVDRPIISTLIRQHDVEVNILEARVTPNEEGEMFVRISGTEADIEEAVSYLVAAEVSVSVRPDSIIWNAETCVSCGACLAQCLPHALAVDPASEKVTYDADRCIACLLCLDACPYNAVQDAGHGENPRSRARSLGRG